MFAETSSTTSYFLVETAALIAALISALLALKFRSRNAPVILCARLGARDAGKGKVRTIEKRSFAAGSS
jgi:hypothetical protein